MRIKADEMTFEGMTYGVEIEYTGVSREKIAKLIGETVHGVVTHPAIHLDNWEIKMEDGRKWQVESDCSVTGSGHGYGPNHGGEVVTPVLTIADMPMLQEVVRAMRKAGARTDKSCGGHVHVGAADMTPVQIVNLVKLFYKNEELILNMCRVRKGRWDRHTARAEGLNRAWCEVCDHNFVDKICDMTNPTMDKINAEWFWTEGHGNVVHEHTHYTNCRYRALNLTNLWPEHGGKCKHTVEFRLFEGCGVANEGRLHAGVLRAFVILALLLVKKAKDAKAGTIKNRYEFNNECAKFYARVFLQNIGFIGDYTAECRKHLMDHLGGTTRTVWRGRENPEAVNGNNGNNNEMAA